MGIMIEVKETEMVTSRNKTNEILTVYLRKSQIRRINKHKKRVHDFDSMDVLVVKLKSISCSTFGKERSVASIRRE